METHYKSMSRQSILLLSIVDYKQLIATIFNAPVDEIYLSDKFFSDQEQYVAVLQQILHLSCLYDLRNISTQRVVFESKSNCYGVVEFYANMGQNITCINFGDSSRAAFSDGRFSRRLSESAIDKMVVTHEFAHVLSGSKRATAPAEMRYWQELAAMWQSYRQFAGTLAACGGLISEYSLTNIDEFHAEAFTEYHLSDEPSKVAVLVGELINKYFAK